MSIALDQPSLMNSEETNLDIIAINQDNYVTNINFVPNMPTQLPSLSINRVLVPMVKHMIATSITLPLEMLEAGYTYKYFASNTTAVDVRFCARNTSPLTISSGLKLIPDYTFNQSGAGDLVLVPALWRNPLPVIRKNPDIIKWLQEQYDTGAVFVVAGTGVAFMAQAGLLDQKPAATHWFYLNKLQRHFPRVDFKPNHLITRSGRIYCAGSVNSVADLMVHLLSMALGESAALKVEQQFSHEIRRPFKDTYFSDDHTTAHQDEVIVNLQAWIHQHFTEDIMLEHLCQKTDLNSRTLTRRFYQATNSPPMAYIQQIRLDQARDLLRNTNLDVADIAMQIGYSDPNYFSRLFKRQYQLTPSDFRRSVREKLFYLNE